MRLLLILLIVPLVEIGLFIQVGNLIGLWPTLLVVVATAVAGAVMLRQQGAYVFVQLRDSASAGSDPSRPFLLHGLLLFVSALLLLTPGFFTDAIGFLLLFPRGRDFVIDVGTNSILSNVEAFADSRRRYSHSADDIVVDEAVEIVEPDQADGRR